jgi:hypothetical protein
MRVLNRKISSMSFGKGLIKGLTLVAALGMTAVAAPGFAQATKERPQVAQAKGKTPAPTPATERGPSNVELVNKALNPGASDPDVPLPHPGLANSTADQPTSPAGPQIFGRQEQGGGVLGLRMPFPADRSATGGTTRYSSP